jgi:hypothetical protein
MSRSLRGGLLVEDFAFDHRLHPYSYPYLFIHSTQADASAASGRVAWRFKANHRVRL